MGNSLTLLLATESVHKQKEFEMALGSEISLLSLKNLRWSKGLPVEFGSTYEENASIKALYVGRETGLLTIADDSGFEVEALQGGPGVLSARFHGGASSQEQCREILRLMKNVSHRAARFVCCLALYNPSNHSVNVFRGECQGTVSEEIRGEKGFGYDPIFIPLGHTKTFSEISTEEKWALSHRGRAVTVLRSRLVL